MFVVPSTLQLLLAIALILLGVSGNLAIPFVSYRSTLRCPHITVLAALDFTATLLGPGLMIVTLVTGPIWLEHSKTLCQSLIFLSSWVQIAGFLVLFFLAVFCQKVEHRFHLFGKLRVRKKELVLLAVSLLTGSLLSIPPVLGWSSYNGLSLLNSCTLLSHVQTFSDYTIIYLACSFTVLFITMFLTVRAIRRRRFYPMHLLWERHTLETEINDPEMTTAASSNTTSKSPTKGPMSRRSSLLSGRLSSVVSCYNSPISVRKASQRSRSIEGTLNILLEITARERTPEMQSGNGGDPSTAPEVPEQMKPCATSGMTQHSIPGNPFVISSMVPYPMWTRRKKIFENPRSLPPFKGLQQQRSLSRLLLLRCCLTLLCWLPLYVLLVLHLCSINYPQQVQAFIKWLIFLQSSISPLLLLCDASYRLVCRGAAISCFKICAVKNKTHVEDLTKSRDVESRIEGSQEVQLRDVIALEGQKL